MFEEEGFENKNETRKSFDAVKNNFLKNHIAYFKLNTNITFIKTSDVKMASLFIQNIVFSVKGVINLKKL